MGFGLPLARRIARRVQGRMRQLAGTRIIVVIKIRILRFRGRDLDCMGNGPAVRTCRVRNAGMFYIASFIDCPTALQGANVGVPCTY